MRYATILGTGHYVPSRVLGNSDLEAMLGEQVDQWLREKVGIAERHIMADDQCTSDLCVEAARPALLKAGIAPEDINLIIIASDTPDYLSPATASVVQAKLGAKSAGTYDINCACASFVTALDTASKTIMADTDYHQVLVIGAYGMSRFIDWSDKKTCTLFADGAGAAVLGASAKPGILACKLSAHGEFHDALGIYTGGTHRPATPEEISLRGKPKVQFVKKFPPTFNTERWPEIIYKTLQKASLDIGDVSLFLFTQLNARTIEAVMAVLGQPLSKTHWIMDKWGYTGSACIPMVLDDAYTKGMLKPGDTVVLCASGGGIAMAAMVLQWTL